MGRTRFDHWHPYRPLSLQERFLSEEEQSNPSPARCCSSNIVRNHLTAPLRNWINDKRRGQKYLLKNCIEIIHSRDDNKEDRYMRGTVTQLGELERGVVIEGDHHDNKV